MPGPRISDSEKGLVLEREGGRFDRSASPLLFAFDTGSRRLLLLLLPLSMHVAPCAWRSICAGRLVGAQEVYACYTHGGLWRGYASGALTCHLNLAGVTKPRQLDPCLLLLLTGLELLAELPSRSGQQ